jgi:hypothetical protein
MLIAVTSKSGGAQAAWDAIEELIHKAGEPGAPLHLKIRAYHVDLASCAVERQGLILEQSGAIVLVQCYHGCLTSGASIQMALGH